MWVCVRAARARCPFADELFWRRISSQSALLERHSLLALVDYAVSVMSPAGAGSPRLVPPTACAGSEGSSGENFSFAAAADAPSTSAWNCRGDSADLGFGRRPVRMAVESPRWEVPWQNVGRGRGATALRT